MAELIQKEKEFVREIDAKSIKLSNLNKIYWPDEKITKGELLNYYEEIAPFILPHLKDRPQSLHRFPEGIGGESFYHKNVEDLVPEWMETLAVKSDSENKNIVYMLANDLASLLFMINLGCIEINPWLSRKGFLQNPDFVVIDLDPEDTSFDKVIDVTLVIKNLFSRLEIFSLPKTSGATGMHIYIPFGPGNITYEQARMLGELLAQLIHSEMPDITSIERSPQKRQQKVYIDWLQNVEGQTLAAPYSIRPFKSAPVSAPLQWGEVTKRIHPENFNIKNFLERLEKRGDLFKDVLVKKNNLKKILKNIEKLQKSKY